MDFSSEFARQFVLPVLVGTAVAALSQLFPRLKSKPIGTRVGVPLLLFVLAGAITYTTLKKNTNDGLVIAGTVVDYADRSGIGGAEISIVGRTETCVTEDNGNFRLTLVSNGEPLDQVRLRAQKVGYAPKIESVIPPTHTVELQLRKIPK